MKKITELTDDILFLKKMYEAADTCVSCINDTNVLEIRNRAPEFTGKETAEEKEKMWKEQAKTNLLDMAKSLMVEYPEKAVKLFQSLIILDDGEEMPHGIQLVHMAMSCIVDPYVLDFFVQAVRAGQMISNA